MLPESCLSSEKLHANVSGSEVTCPTIAVSSAGFVTTPYPETEIRTGRPEHSFFSASASGSAHSQDSETASIETEYEQAHRVAVRLLETDAKHGQGTDNPL